MTAKNWRRGRSSWRFALPRGCSYSGRRQFSKPFAKPVLSSTRTLENLHHLRARVPTRTQGNRGNRHVKLIRDRLHHSFVGGTTHRGRCNPDLEQISVPTRFRARRAGVHSHGDDHACLTLSRASFTRVGGERA